MTENIADISEQEYDEIMRKARKAYEFQKKIENPYAFQCAFEYAQNQLARAEQGISSNQN